MPLVSALNVEQGFGVSTRVLMLVLRAPGYALVPWLSMNSNIMTACQNVAASTV